jgi:hypothetical protein
MKKTFILGLFAVAISTVVVAQEEGRTIEKKELKTIKKEVKVEEKNGVKTLTISTDENGNKSEQIYVGEEADKKLAELNEGAVREEGEVKKEVKMEEIDGKKKLTIITKSNGNENIEVFEGEEAEAKLKELENDKPSQKRADEVIIKKTEKTVIKKESM